MTAGEMHDLVSLYALDALEGEEHERFVHHLGTCPDCQTSLIRQQHTLASLVPDQPASDETWERISAAIATDSETADNIAPLRRKGRYWQMATAMAAAAALIFASLLIFDEVLDDGLTPEGIAAAASQAANEPGAFSGEFLVEEQSVARVVLAEDGRGFVVPAESLQSLDESRTYQLWVINENDDVISAGVLGNRPAPATFTWTGDVSGFVLTREVAGGVASSAGDIVSAISDR